MRYPAVAVALLGLVVAPGVAQERTAGALAAFRQGAYDEAVDLYRGVWRSHPDDTAAVRGLMRSLIAIGQYDDALEVGMRVRADLGAAADNLLGEALLYRGRWDEAEQAFSAARAGAADSLIAELNLALLEERRGNLDAAARGFDRFIDVYNARRSRLSAAELAAVATAVKRLGRDNSSLYHDATRAYQESLARDPAYLRAELLLGELFLEKYNGSEARTSFEAVLAKNPNDPRGLIGKAKALRFAGEPGFVELAERALDVNESLVEAMVFLAMHHLEVQDRDEAEAMVEKAMAVDPRSLEAMSVLAAIRFVEGDDGGFEQMRERVLALNPRYAAFYNTVADAAVRGRLYERATALAREAIQLDPKSWRAFGLLGINQLRIGLMDSGRGNLEVAFAGDPFDVWTKNTLDLLDDVDTYSVVETDHFSFVIDRPEAELLTTFAADVAEQAFERFVAKYGYTPSDRIRIEMFPTHADFSVRTVGLVGMGALGVSFGPVVAMDAPAARLRSGEPAEVAYFNWGSTLWHEIAHSFHLGMSAHRVPRWFTEGLAVYEERQARQGWGDGPVPEFLIAYREGHLWPVSALENGFVRPRYPQQLLFSYYQSSLVCELIARDHGEAAFRRLLSAFRSGATNDEAFRRALGVSIKQFDEQFNDFVDAKFVGELEALRGYSLTPDERPAEEHIAARAEDEPGDFFAQLLRGKQLLEEDRGSDAIPYLERAVTLFPDYAGSGSPYLFLARAREGEGDVEGAARDLEALLERNAGHYAAAVKLADLRESLGNREGVLRALDRAVYVFPYEADLHRRAANVATQLEAWEVAIRARRAVLALDPVDRATALYELARAYFEGGHLSDARRVVLTALEIAPGFADAQELLLEIHESRPDR